MIKIVINFSPLLIFIAIIIQIFVILAKRKVPWEILKFIKFIPAIILGTIGISLYLDSQSSYGLSSLGFFYASLLFTLFAVISLIVSIVNIKRNH